jgi:hypothetical protein
MTEHQPVIIHDQMEVGRSNIYVPLSQSFVIASENSGQRTRSVENLVEIGAALAPQMHCDEDRCREIAWKILCEKRQRFDASRRCANGQNVTIGHMHLSFAILPLTPRLWTGSTSKMALAVGKAICNRYDPSASPELSWSMNPIAAAKRCNLMSP